MLPDGVENADFIAVGLHTFKPNPESPLEPLPIQHQVVAVIYARKPASDEPQYELYMGQTVTHRGTACRRRGMLVLLSPKVWRRDHRQLPAVGIPKRVEIHPHPFVAHGA
jgi:hypothetical protein